MELAAENVVCLVVGYRLRQLVLDEPSAQITHPKMAFECERRPFSLGLVGQVNREELGRQR